jgi:hypothetical protein
VQPLHQQLQSVWCVEHQLSGQQVVRDTAQRVDVGPVADGLSERDLRRHVGRRAEYRTGDRDRQVGLCNWLCQTEIENLDEIESQSQSSEMDVGRLDVAVDEASGMSLFE